MKTPKEIKEFLNNKILANINFTAKEIISDNTPEVEAISIDDFIEWFVSGVLIPNEFYYSQDGKYSWVIQFKEFIANERDSISYYYMLKIHDNTLNSNSNCNNNGWVKATPAQKQLLIDKVQEETGKVWNEDTKMFEDKPKDILVPECINIYTDNSLDPLGISFNNDRQILAFREEFSIYEVFPNTILWEKIDCKLVPTLFSDLKVGDIFTNSFALFDNLLTELDSYLIKLSEENICFIQDSNCVITSFYDLEDCAIQKVDFYIVVPLN